jgi:hypothetical protein
MSNGMVVVDVMGYASDRWINIFEMEVYQFEKVSLPSKSDEVYPLSCM